MRKPKRIFAFGDSFTRYFWACWPEVLALELDAPLYNFGFPAAGNYLTFNALVQASQHYKFDEDDLVIVSWTTPSRKDLFSEGKWIRVWELIKKDKSIFSKEILPMEVDLREYDEVGFLLRDFAIIASSQALLETTGATWYNFKLLDFFSLSFYHETEKFSGPESNKLQELFATPLSKVKDSFIDVLYGGSISKVLTENATWHPRYMDGHALPTEHMTYLERVLNIEFSPSTKVIIQQHEDCIVDKIKRALAHQPVKEKYKIGAWHILDSALVDALEFNRQEIDWSKFFLTVT